MNRIILKKICSVCCIATLFMTTPGISALAAEIPPDESVSAVMNEDVVDIPSQFSDASSYDDNMGETALTEGISPEEPIDEQRPESGIGMETSEEILEEKPMVDLPVDEENIPDAVEPGEETEDTSDPYHEDQTNEGLSVEEDSLNTVESETEDDENLVGFMEEYLTDYHIGGGVYATLVSHPVVRPDGPSGLILTLSARNGTLPSNWKEILDETTGVPSWWRTDLLTIDFAVAARGYLYLPEDSSDLFSDFPKLQEITDLNKVTATKAKNMYHLFANDTSLLSLDLSKFNTAKVTNMQGMFLNCSSLENLDVSTFKTSNVQNMTAMFSGCSLLRELDLSGFNTANVNNLDTMFYDCSYLEYLDLSSFNTEKVVTMSYMFKGCSSLTELDLSGFRTPLTWDMSGLFYGCSKLTEVNLEGLVTSHVSIMNEMFAECSSLENLDLSSFNTSGVYNMSNMFYLCGKLKNLNISSFNTSRVSNFACMFYGCGSLEELDLSGFDTSSATTMAGMFNSCGSLANLDLSKFDTSSVISLFGMFNYCISLKELDLSSFDTASVEINDTSAQGFLVGCEMLTTLKTPKNNTFKSALPHIMYDTLGISYDDLPVLSYSITLTTYIPLSGCTITLDPTSYVYDGFAKKPSVTVKLGKTTLKSGTDYSASYKNNTNAGKATVTVTGKGKYNGKKSASFTIEKAVPTLTFAATNITRTVFDATFSIKLTKITDGTVSFKSSKTSVASVNSSTGLVKIKGIGKTIITAYAAEGTNYLTGSASYMLEVTPVSIENASVAGVSLSYGYSGKAYTPVVTVIVNERTLTEGTDYTVLYENNINPGTATITITGIGKYTGTRIKTFEIVDCVSTIESGKTYLLIPKNNSKTAVCSYSGKMVNNTKVYITDQSSSEAMKFKAVKNSDGTWKFINAKCELALAVQQNSTAVGAGIVLYDQTSKPAQNWKLSKKSDNSFAIINSVTDYSISMSDESAVKGTTLSMAETSSTGLQRFYIAETTPVDTAYDGTYSVRASKNKNYCLYIESSSKEDGANVILTTYSKTNAKLFTVMYSGGGYYRLVNVNSGLCLTVYGNTKKDGANVIQSKWAALSGQRWKIIKNSDGTVTFKNGLGTVLHLISNKTANGTNVVAKLASTSTAQKWYLQ